MVPSRVAYAGVFRHENPLSPVVHVQRWWDANTAQIDGILVRLRLRKPVQSVAVKGGCRKPIL